VSLGDGLFLEDDRTRSHDAPRFDRRVAEDTAVHPDKRALLDGRVVDDDAVADGHAVADVGAVHHRELLNVGLVADGHTAAIAAEARKGPDARALADSDVTDEIGHLRDERRVVDERCVSEQRFAQGVVGTGHTSPVRSNAIKVRRRHRASELDADLVVGARKRAPVRKTVFGSVTQSVVLDSPAPVAVVDPE
jgi:nucleotide-binding universal stress UspA family protein